MRRLTLTVMLGLLLVPALALAAPAGKYKGKVVGDPAGDVSFVVSGNKLKKFTIDSVTATCYPLTAVTVYVPSVTISRSGAFSTTYKPLADSEHRIKLKGKFKGSKASGTVSAGPNCVYSEKWTASKR